MAKALSRRVPTRISPVWVVFLAIICAGMTSSPEAGAIPPPPPDVLIDIGVLPPGKTVTIEFDTAIRNPFPALVNEVSNQGVIIDASMTAVLTDDPDVPGADNPTVTQITATSDLAITKDDGGGTHAPGDAIVYTLSYFNVGDRDETNTVIMETVPANTTLDAGSSTAGWVCVPDGNAGSACTLTIGDVPGGGGGSAVFAVLIGDPVPPGTQYIVNSATVMGVQTDPNPANNNATEVTLLSDKIPDINGDGSVTAADLILLMQDYHTDSKRSDLDNDSWVDWEDLWILSNKWGVGTER